MLDPERMHTEFKLHTRTPGQTHKSGRLKVGAINETYELINPLISLVKDPQVYAIAKANVHPGDLHNPISALHTIMSFCCHAPHGLTAAY